MIVFGGRGVFGSIVTRELRDGGADVTVASRSTGVDVSDVDSCRRALEGHDIAVHCAGPYHALGDALPRACVDVGCHYVDISDDRDTCARVRAMDAGFASRDLVAAYGCSAFPSIAEALAEGMQRPRATLLVGNRNPKGAAAVSSLLRNLHEFRNGVVVDFPEPWGQHRAYTVITPGDVETKACFEFRAGTWWMSVLGRNRLPGARLFVGIGRLLSFWGRSGGAVLCEDLGTGRRAWVHSLTGGQRMAALPAVFAAQAIAAGAGKAGAMTGCELLGGENLLHRLSAAGYSVERA